MVTEENPTTTTKRAPAKKVPTEPQAIDTSSGVDDPVEPKVKKKKKETKKNKNKHKANRIHMKVMKRQLAAITAATERYEKLQDKSSRKKKDGALKDKKKNLSKALKVFRKKSKKTPSNLMKARMKSRQLPKKQRKRRRKSIRRFSKLMKMR